ncbi:hypothetical protein EDD18DRAFT_1205462 [Armillaria luteobubalina]|uniref:Uncharacterized protein n=1 Tax=Armillaria luteobubalina TaxID=153913 RepID=A0AA39PBB9_9AGAR|nr:hypothetical protein EDD18DRAFT_1205462 [Armillaria luteobubalina]
MVNWVAVLWCMTGLVNLGFSISAWMSEVNVDVPMSDFYVVFATGIVNMIGACVYRELIVEVALGVAGALNIATAWKIRRAWTGRGERDGLLPSHLDGKQ